MEQVKIVDCFKDPKAFAEDEAAARQKAIDAFVAAGGKITICIPAKTPRKMTANP